MVDTINAYIHGFRYATDIKPTHSNFEKSIRLSYMDSLTEQMFAHKMLKDGNGKYTWKSNRVPIRINTIHKAANFLNYKDRNLTLSQIRKSLHECALRNKSTHIYEKCYELQQKIRQLTESWTEEVHKFLIEQVIFQDRSWIDRLSRTLFAELFFLIILSG